MNTTVILGGELLKNVTTDVALPVLLCLMIAWVFAKKIGKRLPAAVSFRLKFLSWLWAKRRPFSDSKTFVPVFVAMRDA